MNLVNFVSVKVSLVLGFHSLVHCVEVGSLLRNELLFLLNLRLFIFPNSLGLVIFSVLCKTLCHSAEVVFDFAV